MANSPLLEEFEDRLLTSMGAWFQGERVVFRGKDLFHELNENSWMSILLFGITGREFSENQLAFFERIWTLCASYPEPRIWNNRVAALAGTARTTASLAIGAATAISEATIYGRRPDIRAIDFLFRAKDVKDRNESLAQFIRAEYQKHGVIAGYGRPISEKDERLAPIIRMAKQFGCYNGDYVKLAYEIERTIVALQGGPKMNIAGLGSALIADQGLSAEEFYRFMVLSFSAGMFPCYIDALEKPEGSFFPLRCSRIKYLGKPPRKWQETPV